MASPSLSPVLIQFSNLDTSRYSIFPPAPQQPTLTKNYSPTNKYTKSIKLKRPARGGGRPSWDKARKFALLGANSSRVFDKK